MWPRWIAWGDGRNHLRAGLSAMSMELYFWTVGKQASVLSFGTHRMLFRWSKMVYCCFPMMLRPLKLLSFWEVLSWVKDHGMVNVVFEIDAQSYCQGSALLYRYFLFWA